jgi:hypothetical protein
MRIKMNKMTKAEVADIHNSLNSVIQHLPLTVPEVVMLGHLAANPGVVVRNQTLSEVIGSETDTFESSRKVLVSRFVRKIRASHLLETIKPVDGLRAGNRGLVYFTDSLHTEVTQEMIDNANAEIQILVKKPSTRPTPAPWQKVSQLDLREGERWEEFGVCSTVGNFFDIFEKARAPKQARLAALLACSSCEVMDWCLRDSLESNMNQKWGAQLPSVVAGGLTHKQQEEVARTAAGETNDWDQAMIQQMREENFNQALNAYHGAGI